MPTFVQWVHVTSAVIGVGGLAFLLFILMPSLGALQPEHREMFAKQVMDRFRWLAWSVIVLLLVSGLYSVRQSYWEVAWGKSWAFLTVKIVLALLVFAILLALTLPFKLFDWVRARLRVWLSVAFGLAVAVIFISAYLRPR
jgi:uncharacterized membrane protein